MKIKLKRIFKIIPVPVFYVEKIGNGDFPAGRSYGLWVLIRNKYETDTGLLAHELVHCEQWWKPPFINALLYLFNKNHKYKMELEAYRVQLEYANGTQDFFRLVDRFAWFLCNRYDLDLDLDDVMDDLQEP